MSNSRWLLLSWVLIFATMLAVPLAGRSLGGSIVGLYVNAFAAGILFRGMVDGPRRARERADAIFDASVRDLVKVHRPDVEFNSDEWGG
jgi:hypothetical protein